MWLFAVPAPCVQQAATPSNPSKPALAKEVGVDGRALLIPRLPGDVSQARKELAATVARIEPDIKALERSLTQWMAAIKELPSGQAPGEATPEIQALMKELQDRSYEGLEAEVVARRRAWLKAQTTRTPTPAAKPESGVPAREKEDLTLAEAAVRLRASRGPAKGSGPSAEENRLVENWGPAPKDEPLGELHTGYGDWNDNRVWAQARDLVAQQQRDRMAQPFNAMVEHLETTLRRAAPLLAEPESGAVEAPEHRRLRLALNITLMARCRRALWMSEVMWSDIAGAPPVPVLPSLEASSR